MPLLQRFIAPTVGEICRAFVSAARAAIAESESKSDGITAGASAPEVLVLVSFVAALTACVAAVIALTQNDIKKVLAYSTVSQLGFMFMAVGVGAAA